MTTQNNSVRKVCKKAQKVAFLGFYYKDFIKMYFTIYSVD